MNAATARTAFVGRVLGAMAALAAFAAPAATGTAAAADAAPARDRVPEIIWDGSRSAAMPPEAWRARQGDDTAWARPGYDDAGWEAAAGPGLWILRDGAGTGIRWYRARVRFASPADSLDPAFLEADPLPMAQEIWWDGERIATNGRVGSAASKEAPGRMFLSVPIPTRLAGAGVHVACVRVSNRAGFGGGFSGGFGGARLGTRMELIRGTHAARTAKAFLIGLFCIAGLYHFAGNLAHLQRAYALFALFCLGAGLWAMPVPIGIYGQASLAAYGPCLAIRALGWAIMIASLPLFLFGEFLSLRRPWGWAAAGAAAAIHLPLAAALMGQAPAAWIPALYALSRFAGACALAVSAATAGWAIRGRKEGAAGAAIGLAGLAGGMALDAWLGTDLLWAAGLALLVLLANRGLARRLARQSLAWQELNLKGARLEIELLKKNIQPHFLLTSLRSISDWLEREPKMAARLVNALAAELRMMLKVSSQRTIGLGEEAELCRTHLEVMGLRRHRPLSLELRGIAGDEPVPPMVIHALMEMALDDAEDGPGEIRFRLERRPGPGLDLAFSHGSALKPAWQRYPSETGVRYVEARLEEAFPGAWSLRFGAAEGRPGWTAEIRVKAGAYAAPGPAPAVRPA